MKCPAGGPIVSLYANAAHTIKLCDTEIKPNQAGLSHVTYHNKANAGAQDDITATATLEEMKYQNGAQAGCPDHAEHADMKYIANFTLTSIETNLSSEPKTVPGEDGIWISDEA